ncbi:carbon-nitrogen hydrolase family protein [Shewanella xiamenensis]|uniref:Carbon-nitrogen hydrolase family protein n=1 Tax=Shewanella xiamenensis TaxID=332186 RepID=A0AAW6R2L2_9GAMM|nr:carbon-nitrogen hydrolase family protein [Shewanella xiamenensis]MDG5902066.1 carbon-nitrogen hydrolase family protein [Shewanella xiamenensis]
MRISLLQCQSSRDVSANLLFIESQLEELTRERLQWDKDAPHLVVLPECSLLFGGHESQQLAYADDSHLSPLKSALSALAARYSVYMVAGTIPALAEDGRVYSRCYLFDDKGDTLGQYDKLHLFDVDVADGTKQYRESETFCPGNHISVIDTPFGKIGLTICYDLRFPDLFRALRLAGAEIITVPSAFTKVTGEAHWQVLLQARAIETQCFILAAAQWGAHNEGSRETWGQSMVIGPWGEVIAEQKTGTGWVHADIDVAEVHSIRSKMPVAQHNRFTAPNLKP